jgi:hypothetical protein
MKEKKEAIYEANRKRICSPDQGAEKHDIQYLLYVLQGQG